MRIVCSVSSCVQCGSLIVQPIVFRCIVLAFFFYYLTIFDIPVRYLSIHVKKKIHDFHAKLHSIPNP